jgi:drug/metabolite transporter (DMT)-like permease
MLWLAVVARIISNPLSNVFQKLLTNRGVNPMFVIFAGHAGLSIVCAPFLAYAWRAASAGFWFNIWLSAVLAVAGNILLVEALKRSDLSVLGPINAYKSVVSLIPGVILLNEIPGPWGLAGIILIVAGSYFVAEKTNAGSGQNVFARFLSEPGIQLRLGALVLSAIEAVFLKRALLASSAYATFIFWSILGLVISLPVLAFARVSFASIAANKSTYALLALTTGIMQLCTLLVMEHLPVSAALALFQTSALLSVFFGHAVFKEADIARRLAGSAIMVAGAALIILHRGR